MADVDVASGIGSGKHPSQIVTTKMPYVATVDISIAAAVTAKGSALAAADVLQAMDIPAGTMILGASVKKVDAPTGTVSAATLDVGVGGVDVDVWVDGFDYYAASVGDWAQNPAVYQPITITAADTVDVIIASLTGTLLTGTIRLSVLMVDLEKPSAPGLAALRS